MFDPQKLYEMLGDVQEKIKEAEAQSKDKEYTATSGGGMVSVKCNGDGEVIDISFSDELLSDKESLQILLMSAVNDVYKKVEEGRKQAAFSMFGDLGNLGNFNFKP